VRQSRRRFLASAGLFPLAALANGAIIEPRRVTISRHRVPPLGVGSGSTLRVVQLSDLHLQDVGRFERRIAEHVNGLGADVIALTGDAIDKADRIEELDRFLRLLKPGPTRIATLGNWEHWGKVDLAELRRTYEASGCHLMVNESSILRHDGVEVLVTGVDDLTGGAPDIRAALAGMAPRSSHLVIAHSPLYRDVLAAAGWSGGEDEAAPDGHSVSLMLSGHTHGGQVSLFGWAPVRPPGSGRYVAGWYRDGGLPMYVSRGLGTSVAPIRFGSPPEIAVFDWVLAG
jgi:uncharacterized protein